MSTTTKTNTTATKKPAAKPAPIPAPTCADDLPHAHALANQLREIESILEQEAVLHDAPVADQVRELVLALHDATEAIADARCILSAFFGAADGTIVGVATSAVAYAQELERTIKGEAGDKALSTWAAVCRTVCKTILSGRGEIQISIRPSWPVAPETDTEAEP